MLQRLHRAERLSEEFLDSLLGRVYSGFSVHGEQTVPTEDVQGAERLARYLTRGPLPLDVVEKVEGGRLRVRTPPDPRAGLVEKILDPLELIHALTTQIPDPGQHMVRYYAWYSNRSRGARRRIARRRPCDGYVGPSVGHERGQPLHLIYPTARTDAQFDGVAASCHPLCG